MRRMRNREDVFPGVLGYDETVVPQLQNAILARHDFILLGLRGQAKTRLLRHLSLLLDEAVPYMAGSELREDPLNPITGRSRERLADEGDDVAIAWLSPQDRYAEKLATPDTSIADLIGDIDPIKAATRRLTYADEEAIHFGLIPRMHRGIFALNELPDLPARIQVGLLNVMEEQDVQIRGFNVRMPIDVQMVFTANPEDYTNRGSIITPLKDRVDSQILTHYPRDLSIGVAITSQEAWQDRSTVGEEVPDVAVPHFLREIVEQIAFEARKSEYVDQKSGVSARLTRAALEDLISAAERRAILNGEQSTTARISDLKAVEPAITGKVELVYEGEQEGVQQVAQMLIGRAAATIFKRYLPDPTEKSADVTQGRAAYTQVLQYFATGGVVELHPTVSDADYESRLYSVPALESLVKKHTPSNASGEMAVVMEFVLEVLHQHSLLGKDEEAGGSTYGDMMGAVLGRLGAPGDDDDELDDYRERYG